MMITARDDRQHTLLDLIGAVDNLSEPTPSWNRATTIIPTLSVFLVITYLCVIFRLYTRFIITKNPGWDDLFVVLVLISGTMGSICICLSTQHGFGGHFIMLFPYKLGPYLHLFYIANASYTMSTAFVKLALLFQYLRIYSEGLLRRVCIGLAVITTIWGCVYAFLAWFPCFPVRGYWTWTITAQCYGYGSLVPESFYATYSSMSAINMVLDFIILAIPIPLYFRKDTPSRTKLGLCGLLVMGGLVNFLSIWRVATIVQHKATTSPTFDPTWYGPISIILASLEVDVATICAAVPVFWPILTSKFGVIFVTREIKIEHSHRFSAMDDEYELRSGSSSGSPSVGSSKETNDRETNDMGPPRKAHYKDKYIIAQVDPLETMGRVQLEIKADGGKNGESSNPFKSRP